MRSPLLSIDKKHSVAAGTASNPNPAGISLYNSVPDILHTSFGSTPHFTDKWIGSTRSCAVGNIVAASTITYLAAASEALDAPFMVARRMQALRALRHHGAFKRFCKSQMFSFVNLSMHPLSILVSSSSTNSFNSCVVIASFTSY